MLEADLRKLVLRDVQLGDCRVWIGEHLSDDFRTFVIQAITAHVEHFDIREVLSLHQFGHEGDVFDCLIPQVDRLVHAYRIVSLELIHVNMPVDCLVLLKLFVHPALELATDTISVNLKLLNMLVLLQCVHELFHLLIADRIVTKIDMLNEPELPHKLGQEIKTLDFVLAKLEAHG